MVQPISSMRRCLLLCALFSAGVALPKDAVSQSSSAPVNGVHSDSAGHAIPSQPPGISSPSPVQATPGLTPAEQFKSAGLDQEKKDKELDKLKLEIEKLKQDTSKARVDTWVGWITPVVSLGTLAILVFTLRSQRKTALKVQEKQAEDALKLQLKQGEAALKLQHQQGADALKLAQKQSDQALFNKLADIVVDSRTPDMARDRAELLKYLYNDNMGPQFLTRVQTMVDKGRFPGSLRAELNKAVFEQIASKCANPEDVANLARSIWPNDDWLKNLEIQPHRDHSQSPPTQNPATGNTDTDH